MIGKGTAMAEAVRRYLRLDLSSKAASESRLVTAICAATRQGSLPAGAGIAGAAAMR